MILTKFIIGLKRVVYRLLKPYYERLNDRLHCTTSCFGSRDSVHIGLNCSLVNTQFNTSSGEIYIDDYTFAGHNVSIITGTHDIRCTKHARQTAIPHGNNINIGKGVWLCSNSIILGPCEIEDDSVIAAGAVVLPNTHVKRGEIWGGVPAKKISDIIIDE